MFQLQVFQLRVKASPPRYKQKAPGINRKAAKRGCSALTNIYITNIITNFHDIGTGSDTCDNRIRSSGKALMYNPPQQIHYSILDQSTF